MRKYDQKIGIFIGAAVILLAAKPLQAAITQITGVKVEQKEKGIHLILTTVGQQEKPPQIFTVPLGHDLIADIPNSQLMLPNGESFRQENPFPGIAAIEVSQLGSNSIRVVVKGEKERPTGQVVQQGGGGITLSFAPPSLNLGLTAEKPGETPPLVAQTEPPIDPFPNQNEVLIPNPDIRIDGQPVPNGVPQEPAPEAPQFLPRAVAPPVGDIAVSSIDSSPEIIDLGTDVLIPRLVLREAPAREVLSLLARAAGLNLVLSDTVTTEGSEATAAQANTVVSLDLENQPVEEVFNSVLTISGLQASRKGNTIYVGARLPQDARNVITRTFRLNQVGAESAAVFLGTQGAEVQILEQTTEDIINPETNQRIGTRLQPPTIRSLTAEQTEAALGPLLLRGLTVTTDDRLNLVTMVGDPKKVEIATALLTQLDARRRQVAVNVKVIDVNLLNEKTFGSSFSFGFDNGFFVQDQGSALLNFGGINPPNTAQASGTFFPPITPLTGTITDPSGAGFEFAPFFDPQSAPFNNINTDSGFPYARPNFGTNNNPFQPGVSDITDDGVEFSLPGLYQYPRRFLLTLDAQITNGSAKILTDPTLVVQEGQGATVRLVEQVVSSINTEIDSESGVRTITPVIGEAGLILAVEVERIDDNGYISLSVNPTVSAPSTTQDFDSGGGASNQIVLLNERKLSSGQLRLRDGQTLIVSGIIQDRDRVTISKVPILGDLPLLGSLFRSSQRENIRSEVIILLTPQIIDDSQNSNFGYDYTPSPEAREILQPQPEVNTQEAPP
ncbi:MAG: AMIN domain-containing protein [Gomphosphaeria aponina SAG 52.96 = DSM 107014]|uniref:AMIN domain-containing protein n=1 Tax=Gomphosphaeria aponina SAG 52.96 = DSM 107014 TaxID=1521640 RepID=A0A941JRZ9_9CHRO|nr:AMIN domain-containing protein [Gomphosphaeria aponina SAG 52.96 = DSM 107014]